jgi:putative colanic acid biosynthesis glycosyltransferase
MNKGIAIAKGNFLIFMNGGDTFADPDILDKIEPLTKNGSDLIYGDSMEAGHYKSARTPSYINWGLFTHHQAIFYNRIILGDMRYDTSFKIAADYDLTLHFLKKHSNTNYISEPICIFEQGGVSQTQAELGRNEQFTSRQKNNACSQCHNHFIRLAQKTIWTVREKAAPLYWLLKKFF